LRRWIISEPCGLPTGRRSPFGYPRLEELRVALLADREPTAAAQVLAFAAAALLFLAGIAPWSHGGWCRPTAVVGLAVSTALLLLLQPLVPVHPRRRNPPPGRPPARRGSRHGRAEGRGWRRPPPCRVRPTRRGPGPGSRTSRRPRATSPAPRDISSTAQLRRCPNHSYPTTSSPVYAVWCCRVMSGHVWSVPDVWSGPRCLQRVCKQDERRG
jgi:hypothetical protein